MGVQTNQLPTTSKSIHVAAILAIVDQVLKSLSVSTNHPKWAEAKAIAQAGAEIAAAVLLEL